MARHKLLTTKEVSEWLQIPEATLKRYRCAGREPKKHEQIPFLTLPNGDVRYREDLVNQWIEDRNLTDRSGIKRTG